jgi:two-component system, NarL family, sensor kinase
MMLSGKILKWLLPVFLIASCSPEGQHSTTSLDDEYQMEIILADSAYNACFNGDSVATSLLTLELIKMADTLINPLAKADGYRTAAMVYNNWMDYENAFFYYRKAESILNGMVDEEATKLKAKIWLNISMLYIMGGDYNMALDYALRGDSIFTHYNMVAYLVNAYAKLSEVHERMGNKELTILYNKKLFELSQYVNDPFSLVTCYIGRSNQFSLEGNTDMALAWLDSVDVIAKEHEFLESQMISLLNRAIIIKRDKNDTNLALKSLLQALPIARTLGNPYQTADVLVRIANNFLQQNQTEKAIEYLNVAQSLALTNNLLDIQRIIASIFKDIYIKKQNFPEAIRYYTLLDSLNTTHYHEQASRDLIFTNAQYEAKNKELSIARLTSENLISQVQIRQKNFTLTGGAIIFILVMAVLITLIRTARQKHKISLQDQKIQSQLIKQLESEKQLIELQATLKGEEAERSRIARNLHDGLGGLLSGTKLTLNHMKENFVLSPEMGNSFNKALDLLESSVQELRRVAHNMMPEILHAGGLNDALDSFCCCIPNLKNIQVSYHFYGEAQRLETGLEMAVYRIAQELVNNALKHAKASLINVELIQEKDRVCLSVSDNGQGFDPETSVGNGNGLMGIRSRVKSFSGKLDINSRPDKGSEFLIEFNNLKSPDIHD